MSSSAMRGQVLTADCPRFGPGHQFVRSSSTCVAAARAGIVFVPLNQTVSPPELHPPAADSEAGPGSPTRHPDMVQGAAAGCPRLKWPVVVEDASAATRCTVAAAVRGRTSAPSVSRCPTDVARIVYT